MRSPTLSRWYWLLRSHRPSQLLWRAWRMFERKLSMRYWRRKARVGEKALALRPATSHSLESLAQKRRRSPPASAVDCEGTVSLTFLGITRAMLLPADWRCDTIESVPHLWRFHLHDQQWLMDLSPEFCWQWVVDWIDENNLSDRRELSDAWHPFCISRRIVMWMLQWTDSPPDEHQERILHSLARQVMFLSHHLEWDLRGNHLLFNLWALGIAAAFFDGETGDHALKIVRKYLPPQLKEQILPSGEHFERSPMYHAEMLEVIGDLGECLASVSGKLATKCDETSASMQRLYNAILHPDGEIPLLADSAFDQIPHAVLDKNGSSEIQTSDCGQGGDYWRYYSNACSESARAASSEKDRGDFLLFDTGPVGADELPAHAHCDLLGLEASIGGRRFLVDSGVFDYEDSEMRMYCRSTFAHNVLQIDDVDQCDVWSRFRMGYRGWPTSATHGTTDDGFHWCRATHNAYRRIGVREVGRLVACRDDGLWVIADWAGRARGKHQLASRLHLHPDVKVESVDDVTAKVAIGERSLLITGDGPGRLVIENGWYCPRFGERHENLILSWKTDEITLPAAIAWLIQPFTDTPATLKIVMGLRVELTIQAGTSVIELSSDMS